MEFLAELTYGIINNLDFEVELPYRFLRVEGAGDEDGLGDLKLKSKIRFIKGRRATAEGTIMRLKNQKANEVISQGGNFAVLL